MAYPRELNLSAETEQRLIQHIEDEILIHYAERNRYIEDLMRFQKEYWAAPTDEKATFPFHNASTIVIPITAISVESIYARVMTTRFALDDIVSVHPVSPDWTEHAVPVERFMNHELLKVMKIRRELGDCYLTNIKYGAMVGKVTYEKKVKTSVREVNGVEHEVDVVIKDGAELHSIPPARFIMPFSDLDPQVSRWCGEEHSNTPYDVMLMEAGGLFKPGTIIDGPNWKEDTNQISKLHYWINRTYNIQTGIGGNRVERAEERLEHREPQWPKRIDWIELQLSFDIDNSGRQKEIVVHYHRDARYLMSVRYNWHSDLRRQYRTAPYFPLENRWTGIGVCKQNEQFQKEITVQHRQKLDNGTLVNMRMLKVHKNAGYGAKEPVFPGKMWFLDDMSHIEAFQMGEIYPSGYQNEQSDLIYSQMRTGVNEVTLGQPQVGTPSTATSDLARIQEGNKKFDLIYDNMNVFTHDIIMDIADCIQQFGPRQLSYLTTAENGKMVEEFFQMPSSYIRDNIILDLRVTSQQSNRLLDRQNWQQITQGITAYIQGIMELAQISGNQQLAQELAVKGMASATEAFEQFLQTFDIRNVDRIAFGELKQLMKNGLQNGVPANNGSNGGTPPNGQNSRMGNFINLLPQIGSPSS
jgi:hypothetical protein